LIRRLAAPETGSVSPNILRKIFGKVAVWARPAVVFQMKVIVLLVVLCSAGFAATAPDSIANKVFRQSIIITSVRSSSEKTIVFGPDGRCTYLKSGFGGALILTAPYKIFLGAPRADGTYTYARTGDATATINLNLADGSKETLSLTFMSASGGSDGSMAFWFSDLALAQSSPANNISMRGHVSPGHPLIVGFVVPGDSSASAPNVFMPPDGVQQREVLIRVVGPSLGAFGVTDTWADPDFQLFRGATPAAVAAVHYANWCVPPNTNPATQPDAATEAAFRKIFNSPLVGAFPLISGSRDAADVVRLNPGAYTIVCTAAAGDPGGEALVEAYFLP
jgi:hypothetical protein